MIINIMVELCQNYVKR